MFASVFARRMAVLSTSVAMGTAVCAASLAANRTAACEENLDGEVSARVALIRRALRPWTDEKRAALQKQWELDEEGYSKLPSRAWPKYQPKPTDIPSIEHRLMSGGCREDNGGAIIPQSTGPCASAAFDLATALVFYNLDPSEGLGYYKSLASAGHIDGMVAAGICLVEGFGVPAQELEGLAYLRRSVEHGSAQGHYELGTALFTGLEGFLEEDESEAFQHFEAAAKQGHLGGCFMAADCLLNGSGCNEDVTRAVPLLFQAAEGGHRFARQTLRELFAL